MTDTMFTTTRQLEFSLIDASSTFNRYRPSKPKCIKIRRVKKYNGGVTTRKTKTPEKVF